MDLDWCHLTNSDASTFGDYRSNIIPQQSRRKTYFKIFPTTQTEHQVTGCNGSQEPLINIQEVLIS